MRLVSFMFVMLITFHLVGQNFSCDQYRKIMDEEMDAMNFDQDARKYIIGAKSEYYLVGMSDHFISVPEVPKYIYESDNINPHMAKIIIAHVDLYHCDLIEKEITKTRSTIKIDNEIEVNIFPNPSSGILNIDSKNQIVNLVVFNATGSLIQRFNNVDGQINLAKLSKGIYYLQISNDTGNTIKKVILE